MTIVEPSGDDFSSRPDPAHLSHRIYAELRQLAERHFRDQPSDHTLQPTALVHEAFVRIAGWEGACKDEKHLFRKLAKAMRQVLVDHARKRNASKRGGDVNRQALHESAAPVVQVNADLLVLDEALEQLRRYSERGADVVELRFFGGLTEEQTAKILEVSRRTVQNDWDTARAVLSEQLGDGEA